MWAESDVRTEYGYMLYWHMDDPPISQSTINEMFQIVLDDMRAKGKTKFYADTSGVPESSMPVYRNAALVYGTVETSTDVWEQDL